MNTTLSTQFIDSKYSHLRGHYVGSVLNGTIDNSISRHTFYLQTTLFETSLLKSHLKMNFQWGFKKYGFCNLT